MGLNELTTISVLPHPCLKCQYSLGQEQRGCLVATLNHQYALCVREDIDATQIHQGVRVQRGDQGNLRVDSCDDTCPHAYQVSYVSLLPLRLEVTCVLGSFEIDFYQDSLTQILVSNFGFLYIWDLRLSPQHDGSASFRFHEVGWQCFLYH